MRREPRSPTPNIQSRIPLPAARPITPRQASSPLPSQATSGSSRPPPPSRPSVPLLKRGSSGIPHLSIFTPSHQSSSAITHQSSSPVVHRSERACCTALRDIHLTPPPSPLTPTRRRSSWFGLKRPPTALSPTISSIAKRIDYPTPESIITKRGESPSRNTPSRLPIRRSSQSHSSPTQRPAKKSRTMSYDIPKPHVVAPCTHNSLTHRLVCSHLIITNQPTEECAGNCLDARGKPARSPYSIPINPRNLDKVFLCPKDCRLDPTVFPPRETKRRKMQLCQLIPESVVDEEAQEERVRSVAMLSPYPSPSPMLDEFSFGTMSAPITERDEERVDEKHQQHERYDLQKSPHLLAGPGHKRKSSKNTKHTSFSSFSSLSHPHTNNDLEDETNDNDCRKQVPRTPRTPEPRHHRFPSDVTCPMPGSPSTNISSPTPSMVNRHRLSIIMMHKAQRDSAISVPGMNDSSPGVVGLGIATGVGGSPRNASISGGGRIGSVSGGSASVRRSSVVGQTGLKDLRLAMRKEYA